jgi:putative methionine-R-sulfoxide reductase with GAF domain
MANESELQAARRRIAELEAETARLQARSEDVAFVQELRARLAQVGATGALSAPTEHSALLQQIVQAAMHVLNARAGSLYLVEEESEQLVWEVALGERASQLVGQRIPLGQGVAGWVAATGQAIAVADVQQDPRWAQDVGRAVGYAPKTMLAMPLLLRDRVTGVLQLLDKDGGRPFSAGDMETLGRFANQAAVAIEQSRAVRSLVALMRVAITNLDEEGDLVARAAAFAGRTEEGPEYRETMELAGLLGDIARGGDAGRRLTLDLARAVNTYVNAQRRYGM